MNYQNLKTVNIKLLSRFIAAAFLCLVLFFILYSPKSVATSLPDCKNISGVIEPGSNCLFYGLPLCQDIPNAAYSILSENIVSGTQNHRVNCADLSDMPLCDQIDGVPPTFSIPNPIKECVKECVTIDPAAGVRGQDFAVHNRDCVRFCDNPEGGILADPGVNCVPRKCHQMPNGVDPTATNCSELPCNLLTPDELNDSKFNDETKRYCNGDNLKCLDFVRSQLPYVKIRETNPICKIHNCRTESENCSPRATDDVQKILDKEATQPGYVADYQTYVNAGYDISTNAVCTSVVCRPVINRQYRCTPQEILDPVTLNVNCDTLDLSTPAPHIAASCAGGYCNKRIDCNIPANNLEEECAVSSGQDYDTSEDPTNAWFYRPKPPSDALGGNNTISTRVEPGLCYTSGDIRHWGTETFIFGWWHWAKRGPGHCSATNLGHRGNGYVYVCGTRAELYRLPSSEATYFKGYVRSNYVEGGATHTVKVCTRFTNTTAFLNSCGRRECMVQCGFSSCHSQNCGFDKCLDLTIDDGNPRECEMNSTTFNGNINSECMDKIGAGIDSYVRLRAVKYGNNVCAFLDLKGTLAYNPQYFNGSEKLSDGTCISGEKDLSGNCTGSTNTNSSPELADRWRTTMMVPYIKNNRPITSANSPRGYLDMSGRLFKERECPQAPFRVQTPRMYNLANLANSPSLFSPPIYIANSKIKRGGNISIDQFGGPLGTTDFHYPEIEVRFGATSQLLSLGINYNGDEETGGDPQASKTLQTSISGFNYSAAVFIRKEEDLDNNAAKLCLYRRIQDENGVYLTPLRMGCVERSLPEIDNSAKRLLNPLLDLRKVLIALDASSTYSNPVISARYLSSTNSSSNINCLSSNTSCTTAVLLNNPNQESPTCDSESEKYGICAQREECSKLNIECVANEANLSNASLANNPIDSFTAIRRNCNEVLLPICNIKKGFDSSPGTGAFVNFDFNLPPSNSEIYGWFNEICISSGFKTRLKNIIAHSLPNGLKGKCRINTLSPYLTDGNSNTNCDSGGKAPNCLCVEAIDDIEPPAGYEVREETLREAGLCADIPLPETCPAINYNQPPNSNQNDQFYVESSVNKTSYGANISEITNKVHISHRYRTEGKPDPNGILLRGHAEFPKSVFGTNDVEGQCNGFWTYDKSPTAINLLPRLSCINNNGAAEWSSNVTNACKRYKCPQVFTAGPAENGLYQGGYGILESGEVKGSSHGFALWPNYEKTNDFLESVSADSCIAGFKKVGATTLTSSGSVSGQNAINASLYNLITSYSGGTSPTRQCNQLGLYLPPTNSCQRISCPTISPPIPSGASDTAAWELWRNSGGASYSSVNASRSALRIQLESISFGTCNESLGFFRSPGGQSPSRKCDHLGNWLPVENSCTTRCEDISTDQQGGSLNNGFSRWTVPNSTKKVTLHQHCSYTGWTQDFQVGNHPNLPAGFHDASSVVVSPGLKVTLYNGANFTGSSVILTGNLSCFTQYPNLNDNMRSMKVELNGSETLPAQFNGCISGYITNPYPPFADALGNALAPQIANDLTRLPENPMRVCLVQDSGNGFSTSYWGSVVNGCINQCPGSNIDSRIGVGITTHSTSSGVVSLNWPSTSFGADAYVSNFGENLDASYFNSGRSNGYYLVKRHCNTDGRWSTPQPMCAANNGQIGNSKYDKNSAVSGYSDSIAAGEAVTVTGTCATGYWANNYGQDPLPQRSCLFESGNNFIDRTHLELVTDSTDCEEQRCPAFTQIKTTRSMIPSVSQSDVRTKVNGQIVGSCLNNTTNSANTTVYTSLESGSLLPYVTCNSDGTWSQIIGDTNCKHGCDVVSRTGTIDPKDCGGQDYFWFNDTSIAHNEILEFTAIQPCRSDCDSWTYSARCIDGVLSEHTNNVGVTINDNLCPFTSYDYTNNAWLPVVRSSYRQSSQHIKFNATTKARWFKNKYNNLDSCSTENNLRIFRNGASTAQLNKDTQFIYVPSLSEHSTPMSPNNIICTP